MMRLSCVMAALCGALIGPTAQACRCPQEPSAAAAYRRASVVLEAEVMKVDEDRAAGQSTAALQVSRSWKSSVPAELTVVTRTTCAYTFTVGAKLLVYAYQDERYQRLETRQCMGNRPVEAASAAIAWLDRHGPSKAPAAR